MKLFCLESGTEICLLLDSNNNKIVLFSVASTRVVNPQRWPWIRRSVCVVKSQIVTSAGACSQSTTDFNHCAVCCRITKARNSARLVLFSIIGVKTFKLLLLLSQLRPIDEIRLSKAQKLAFKSKFIIKPATHTVKPAYNKPGYSERMLKPNFFLKVKRCP